jgi:putative ABC transport system permease protein
VALQRDQLGALKAFGYTNGEVLGHVLMLALVPTMAGIVTGSALGVWLAGVFAEVYADYFRIPRAAYHPELGTLGAGAGVAFVAALLGGWRAAHRAARLEPAEAMRPEPPPSFGHGVVEQSRWVQRAPTALRMIARGLERRPVRTAGALLGIALAVSVSLVGRWVSDAVAVLGERQFRTAQQEHVQVRFRQAMPLDAVRGLAEMADAPVVEPLRELPVRLHAGAQRVRTAIVALPPDVTLRRVLDAGGRAVAVPSEGLLLSALLAKRLGVRVGDSLRVERLDGRGDLPLMLVAGTVDELLGTGAYTTLPSLARALGEEPVATSVLLRSVTADEARLFADLEAVPAVAGVAVREASLEAFESTIAASLGITNLVFMLFATAIAAGIVYNGARLALSERGRELASLRVLGFTTGEAGRIVVGEQGMLTLVALPIGVLLGVAFTVLLGRAVSTDLFRLPLIVSWRSVTWSVLLVIGVAVLSAWRVQRRVRTLDLVAVLKTRE